VNQQFGFLPRLKQLNDKEIENEAIKPNKPI